MQSESVTDVWLTLKLMPRFLSLALRVAFAPAPLVSVPQDRSSWDANSKNSGFQMGMLSLECGKATNEGR